jgi:hypothetical protein
VPILWIDYFEPQSMLPGMRQVAQTSVTANAVNIPRSRSYPAQGDVTILS